MHEQNVSYLVKHSELGAKILTEFARKLLKRIKMTITLCEFSKICRGSMPPHPPGPFPFLNSLHINFAKKKKKKKRLKNVQSLVPLPKKILITPIHKTFSKCLLTLFFGYKRFCIYLTCYLI